MFAKLQFQYTQKRGRCHCHYSVIAHIHSAASGYNQIKWVAEDNALRYPSSPKCLHELSGGLRYILLVGSAPVSPAQKKESKFQTNPLLGNGLPKVSTSF